MKCISIYQYTVSFSNFRKKPFKSESQIIKCSGKNAKISIVKALFNSLLHNFII